MAKKKVTFDWMGFKGFDELRKSPEMQAILDECAANVLNNLPDYGYAKTVRVHKKRAVAYIYGDTARARVDNLRNNSLLKALGGG